MMKIEYKNLIEQVRIGRVVLFLGAGANKGALSPGKKEAPLGDELRNLIAEKFLGGNHNSDSLSWVSELAISATSIVEVQNFIADQFKDLAPADYHLLIPTFRWKGIATTNYDRVIETAYNQSSDAIQNVVPFLSDNVHVEEKLRDQASLPLLKLHGCITRTNDEDLPLILTIDQYDRYRNNRNRLFQLLEEWGTENTIIFIGHKLQDPDLRSILLTLSKKIQSRPRYYLVKPGVSKEERDFWNEKRISVLDCTFEDMLRSLDAEIPKDFRPLAAKLPSDHPIKRRFRVNKNPSVSLLDFLNNDFEYVHEGISSEQGDPTRFYSGFGQGWYPILASLDVRRGLTNKLLEDIIIRPEEDRPSLVELYLVKAEAGAGKSVLLRRLAWEAATQAGTLCFFSRKASSPSIEALEELSRATSGRIFLFVDNAADNLSLILELIDFARLKKISLTLITAERVNEWNTRCETLLEKLTEEYTLYNLSIPEIERLVNLLIEYESLGPNLIGKSFEEQVNEFKIKADRQLLVALHETNHGLPFEEILLDEYKNIIPAEAQRLYRTVCVLNRLQVPVRAGLISRIHGIPFEEFQGRLFKPLEHVVDVVKLPWGDFAYQARHSEIAQIVFDQVLTDKADRFNEYIRIIRSLNPVYSIDSEALRRMLRARGIHELFPSFEDAKAIYDLAEEALRNNAYFYQQRANYERIRPNGNLSYAQDLLDHARKIQPSDSTIVHTLAEVLRQRAEESDKKLERLRFRREARALINDISRIGSSDAYGVVTELKIHKDEVQDVLIDKSSTDRDIDEKIRAAERAFEIARQRYPGDKFILSCEHEFARLIEDHERSFNALKQARDSNPRDPYIASRFASILVNKEEYDKALECIRIALESNRSHKQLNFQYAELLRAKTDTSTENLVSYYRRAFTKWDDNYESQFWYARFLFESNNPKKIRESKEVFKHLREIQMRYEDRILLRDAIGGLVAPQEFTGEINRIESTHGFLSIDGRGEWVFFHENDVADGVWDHLRSGIRVVFSIGFNLKGPKAINLDLEGGKPT